MAVLIPTFELARLIGEQVELEADTVGQLIERGRERFGQPFTDAVVSAIIVVNGRSISHLRMRRTPLRPADTVWLLKPSSGG